MERGKAVDLSLGSFWKWGLDPSCGQADPLELKFQVFKKLTR